MALSGCATTKPASSPEPLQLDFVLSGKLAVRDARRGVSLNLRWQQAQSGYDIEVWGPLGQGRTRLQGDERHMRVTRGDKLLAEGPPEVVMHSQLGWVAPVRFLPAWIRGEPYHPGRDGEVGPILRLTEAELDESGRFTGFEQGGWQVALSRYTVWPPPADSAVSGASLGAMQATTPGRIVARKDERKVTLVVREFRQ